MSYIIKKIGETYNTPTYFFECDNTSDIKEISTNMVPMGSRCRVINEAQEYVLDSEGQWRPVLKGEPGPKGDKGDPGPKGDKGDPGASSWNDLQDKPFGSEFTEGVLTFDGDLTGKETIVLEDMTLVKMSDEFIPKELFDGITLTYHYDTTLCSVHPNNIEFIEEGETAVVQVLAGDGLQSYATPRIMSFRGAEGVLGIPDGTYFIFYDDKEYTISASCLTGKVETVKPLDEKYMPEHSHKWNDLQDKPFGEEKAIIDILSKEGVSYNEDEGMYTGTLVGIPEVGENYTVTYNGTNYDVSAIDFGGGIIAFGNLDAIGAGENTDEPFAVIINPAVRLVAFMPFDGAQEVSLAIKGYANIIKQLDGKFYISPYVCYIDSLSDSEMKYLYSDPICTQKISYSDFLNSKARPVVLLFGSVQYQPIEVDYEDDYGVATVISLGMNDTIESGKVRRYYTAEYSG